MQMTFSYTVILYKIKKWLNYNFLKLNSAKTETLIIAPEQSNPQIKQPIGALGLSVQPSLRSLGVVFDAAMSRSNLLKTVSFN